MLGHKSKQFIRFYDHLHPIITCHYYNQNDALVHRHFLENFVYLPQNLAYEIND